MHWFNMASKYSKKSWLRKFADVEFVTGLVVVFFLVFGIFTALRISAGSLDVTSMAATATKGPQCTSGQKTCQTDANGNNGYQCVCNSLGTWTCTTKNLSACPIGGSTGDSGTGSLTACTQSQVVAAGLGGSWPASCTSSAVGTKTCQTDSAGNKTGYQCTCIDMSPGSCKFYARNCSTLNLTACPITSTGGSTSNDYVNANIISCGSSKQQCRGDDCHCLSGESCTDQICDAATHASCSKQGRAWCKQRLGSTCCVAGYKCGANSTGCVLVTPPTGTPTPSLTRTIPSITPTITTTYTPSPTRTPTPTPTIPTSTLTPTKTPTLTSTPTPTPVLICRAMRVFDEDNLDITAKLGTIKMGDKVMFRGYAENTMKAVSMTFLVTIDGKETQREIVPVKLVGTSWVATFNYHFNKFGNHVVKIISINK